jgi:hypothetical protein
LRYASRMAMIMLASTPSRRKMTSVASMTGLQGGEVA